MGLVPSSPGPGTRGTYASLGEQELILVSDEVLLCEHINMAAGVVVNVEQTAAAEELVGV